jgi:8-oxo-dGTP diphosphatase
LTDAPILRPSPAAAAILRDAAGRYLLQHRDDLPTIWFPDSWGLFGGALEPDETPEAALRRELREEIGVVPARLAYFTRFDFDFAFAGGSVCPRHFFEATLDAGEVAAMRLGEGREYGFFALPAVLALPKMVPYDHMALYLHIHRYRIDASP